MRKWLLKQRTKPKHVRDNIAFGFASGAAALALAGWLILIPKDELFKSNVAADESPEAFSTFFDQIKEQVAGVRESVTKPASSTQPVASRTTSASTSSSTFQGRASSTSPQPAAIFIMPSASTSASTSLPR